GVLVAGLVPVDQDGLGRRLVLHVVDAGADVDERLEHGMRGHILHALAIDPYLPSVADRLLVLLACSDHVVRSQGIGRGACRTLSQPKGLQSRGYRGNILFREPKNNSSISPARSP